MFTITDHIEPPPDHADKATWRRWLLRRRQMLLEDERAQAAAAIAETLDAVATHEGWQHISIFLPWKGEPNLTDLWRAWHRVGRTLYLPVVTQREGPMVFRRWEPGRPMLQDLMGLPVPADSDADKNSVRRSDTSPAVIPDVWLLPAIGIDPLGHRVGAGKGYYDRTYEAVCGDSLNGKTTGQAPIELASGATAPPRLVGVCFEFAVLDQVVGEPHDARLSGWVSERGWTAPTPG